MTSFRVRILLAPGQEELAQLRPGMTANVEIETGRVDEALKVPLQAILRRERSELPDDLAERLPEQLRGALPAEDASAAEDAKGKKKAKEDDLLDVVYVVKDGVAKVRVLKLGLTDSDEAEVEAGLEPDARVVVGPYRALEKLRDGATVEAKEAEELLLSGDDDDGVAATESRSRG